MDGRQPMMSILPCEFVQGSARHSLWEESRIGLCLLLPSTMPRLPASGWPACPRRQPAAIREKGRISPEVSRSALPSRWRTCRCYARMDCTSRKIEGIEPRPLPYASRWLGDSGAALSGRAIRYKHLAAALPMATRAKCFSSSRPIVGKATPGANVAGLARPSALPLPAPT